MKKGFTLIELLVITFIIGLLLVLCVSRFINISYKECLNGNIECSGWMENRTERMSNEVCEDLGNQKMEDLPVKCIKYYE